MKLLDVKNVAEVLAVSPQTVRRLIALGKLKPIRIGRSVRIKTEDLANFLDRQACPTYSKPARAIRLADFHN